MTPDLTIVENQNLASYTSWLVGGDAEYYVAPRDLAELKASLQLSHKKNWPITILGGGTNTLISDEGIRGLVIHTHHLNKIEVLETDPVLLIEAEAGTPKSEILKIFMKHRLPPAIFFAGLPGDVAGGVVMNAGVGHDVAPKEFCEVVNGFDVMEPTSSGEILEKSFTHDQVEWVYRKSRNWQPGIISRVRLAWPNVPDESVLKSVRDGNKRRKDSQPLNMPSCGSVFKNPQGDHAGRLIEVSGLKGFSIGGAQVSQKHANFIVNTGTATAQDIHQVIEQVQEEVKAQQGIMLTNEVVYLGHW